MKSKEEIEQLAFLKYPRVINDPYNPMEDDNRKIWIGAYSQCQEDMATNSIRFAEWLNENRWYNFDKECQKWCYTFEMGTSLPRKTYEKYYMKTSDELYKIFIQSLNKQD